MIKQKILWCLLIALSLGACKMEEAIENKNPLPIESFEIRPGRDTSITSRQGIIFHFSSQTLIAAEEKVTIEVKTALSRFEMVSEGLSSLTLKDELLESMGMFHLSSPSEVQINDAYPIQVQLPTNKMTTAAKVFTGSNVGTTVKWEESAAIDTNELWRQIAQGEQLFEQHCTNCHHRNLRDQLTGPALGRVTSFRDSSFLMDFTRNSQELIAAGDTLALCLFQHWNNSVMTSFDSLSDPQIWSIYQYIESESIALGISKNEMTYLDSCTLNNSSPITINARIEYTYDENGKIIDSVNVNNIIYQNTDRIISPTNADATIRQPSYYDFIVNQWGWYNIDLYANNAAAEEVNNFKFHIDLDDPERFNGYALFQDRTIVIPLAYDHGTYYLLNGIGKERIKFLLAIRMRIIIMENTAADELEFAYLDMVSQAEDNTYELELKQVTRTEVIEIVNEE